MGQDSTTPIVIPINVVDDPFEEVKTGLIYIGKDLPRDNNLFFIRSNEHFRYCAIFDDERKSRARLDVTEGKLISVGISKGHCVQFVFNNFDIFIGLRISHRKPKFRTRRQLQRINSLIYIPKAQFFSDMIEERKLIVQEKNIYNRKKKL